ncbi:MAG: hypothetical protein A3F67_09685 [Verrucomicrobia bacterium RIFCSPHIGHO2_12_FULL_41_10]|nr:MAG: hypothetical protein A3F67_09685 [Verrucomicrobia bacterium RIFCSPHIGHO2_12_FULL_41_10]
MTNPPMTNPPKTLLKTFLILLSFLFIGSSGLFAQMNRVGQELGEFLEETTRVGEGTTAANIGVFGFRDISINHVENNFFQEADEKWNVHQKGVGTSSSSKLTSNVSSDWDQEAEITFQNAEQDEKEAKRDCFNEALTQAKEECYSRQQLAKMYAEAWQRTNHSDQAQAKK